MRLIVVPVIRDAQGRLLLCKMAGDRGVFPGQWGLPGGGVDIVHFSISPPGGGAPIVVSGMLNQGNHQAH